MQKIIPFFLICLFLIAAGCTKQTPIVNQNTNQPATNANQNLDTEKLVDPTVDWQTYQAENFSLKYPAYLKQGIEQVGVRTTVSFEGKASQDAYTSLLEIASMPNQAGSILDQWIDELISQSNWVKKSSLKISGQTAYLLSLPETEAGNRYVFLSQDGRTMFDMTVQHFDKETADLIISSFVLVE